MAFILIVTTLASSKAVEDEPGQAEELIQENRQTGKCAQRTGGKSFLEIKERNRSSNKYTFYQITVKITSD